MNRNTDAETSNDSTELDSEEEELIQKSKNCFIQENIVSASLIQRRFRIGYAHARRIIDKLHERGDLLTISHMP